MVELEIETLARRLDRVERENRRLKRAGIVAVAVIAAVVLMGQATGSKVAKVVEAERFVVRDASGNTRAVLGSTVLETTQTGAVEKRPPSSLVLFDKEGRSSGAHRREKGPLGPLPPQIMGEMGEEG